MPIPIFVCAAISLVSAAVSFGYSVAALRARRERQGPASMYAFARSLALLLVAVVAIFTDNLAFVAAVALAMTAVQLADAVIGARIQDLVKTVGPAATGVVNLAAVIWMLTS